MITPQHAMEQAYATARVYAREGAKAFRDIFDAPPECSPEAAATFIVGFMQAASIDFAAWAIQAQIEGLRDEMDWRYNDTAAREQMG